MELRYTLETRSAEFGDGLMSTVLRWMDGGWEGRGPSQG